MSCLLNVIDKEARAQKNQKSFFTNNLIITDLDNFFYEIYSYYYHGGYRNILTRIILDNITYIFTIHFLLFNLFFIEWEKLLSQAPDINEKIELTSYISNKNFKKHISSAVILYILLNLYYFQFFLSSIYKFLSARNTYYIYKNKLRVKQSDLENMTFDNIANLLIELQKKDNFCRVKDTLTKYDIVARITRKENYIIALLSNRILTFKIFRFNIMTNYLYTTLRRNLMSFIFKKNEVDINKSFYIINIFRLKIIIQILFQIISLPGEVIFRIVFFLFQNADSIRTKRNICKKQWNVQTLLTLKNYNELKHIFDARISKSYIQTEIFLRSFKTKLYTILNKSIMLIGGSIIFVFIIISLFNTNIANVTICGYNFFVIICIIGFILSFFSNNSDNLQDLADIEDKQSIYIKMVSCLENIPLEWNKSKINKNYKIISSCFYNNLIELLYEIVSIILFPYFWFQLVLKAKDIIDFVRTYSTKVDGLGTVCSFSILNPSVYQSISEKTNETLYPSEKRFRDAKFINSMLCFEDNFPSNVEEVFEVTNGVSGDYEMLDLNEEQKMVIYEKKRGLLKTKTTRECIYEIYKATIGKNENKKFEVIMKNIFFLTSSCLEINPWDIIEKMASEKINHVSI